MEISKDELRLTLRDSFDVDVLLEGTPRESVFQSSFNGLLLGAVTFGAANFLFGGSIKMALAETFACAATSAVYGYKNHKAVEKVYKDLTTITTVAERPDGPELK